MQIKQIKARFCLVFFIIFAMATISQAKEVTLAWDPHEDKNANLIGYNLYYKEGSSVKTNPDGANLVYIPVSDPDFEPDQPSYTVTDLKDDVQYYFTVSAMVGDDESSMSNEVSDDTSGADHSNTSNATPSTGSSSGLGGGCFIDALK